MSVQINQVLVLATEQFPSKLKQPFGTHTHTQHVSPAGKWNGCRRVANLMGGAAYVPSSELAICMWHHNKQSGAHYKSEPLKTQVTFFLHMQTFFETNVGRCQLAVGSFWRSVEPEQVWTGSHHAPILASGIGGPGARRGQNGQGSVPLAWATSSRQVTP